MVFLEATQFSWISPFSASLKRLALSLVIGPLGSDKGSCVNLAPFPRVCLAPWFASLSESHGHRSKPLCPYEIINCYKDKLMFVACFWINRLNHYYPSHWWCIDFVIIQLIFLTFSDKFFAIFLHSHPKILGSL